MEGCFRARPALAARLLILLYAWTFPLLGFIHREASHHTRLPECAGFAAEHSFPTAASGLFVTNLHAPSAESPCAVCALNRSVTLAHISAGVAVPSAPPGTLTVPWPAPGPGHVCAGSPGSRAPPAA